MQTLIYGLFFCCAFLLLHTLIGSSKQAAAKVRQINSRLRNMERDDQHEDVLRKIREKRGLESDGNFKHILQNLGKLVLHSGLPLGKNGIYALMLVSAVGAFAAAMLIKGIFWIAGLAAILGLLLPVLVLKVLVKRRRNKAVTQLPEALDIIIRSLGAGHPVPVAMALVGREMPDPLGSEFGIASDEVSYGANIGQAIQRLADRVGHQDFELFAAMIRLQERTGGNLADLLRSSAETIRDRQKMRLKIKAASAEGRASALILNAAPIGLFAVVNLAVPDFYGEVIDENIVRYGLWGIAGWMVIGNLIMRRMINFKI